MRVILLSPEVADRSCSDCQKWWYNDRGTKFGRRIERPQGVPVPRPRGLPTPCRYCPKIPPGTRPSPENAEELTPENWAAYQYHLECKAIGEWPRDAIVRRNAAIIGDVLDVQDRIERQRFGLTVLHTLKGGG